MLGTFFHPRSQSLEAKKRWLGFTAQCNGTLVVDAGAAHAIVSQNRSLLSIGVHEVIGEFDKGDTVSIIGPDKVELARGQSNYSAQDMRRIRGCRSTMIEEILGHCPYETVVHRDNLTISAEH